MSERRFRYAPTPSHALHLGNGLAAIVGWAAARISSASFIVRVEDIDRTRARDAYVEDALDAMEWLGLDWDEGPRVGGTHGPYVQSQRLNQYDARLDTLSSAGATYACGCSRADIRAAQRAPHLHTGEEVPYPGTCRPSGPNDAALLREGRGGFRLNVHDLGDEALVSWTDRWCGPQVEDVRATCGDVLLGRPNQPTYQLAVVHDDIAMGITDVVRGEDLLGSTARQILLHRAFGASPPRFAHHPLLLDAKGNKLSKRDASIAISAWRAADRDASEIHALLARSVGLVGAGVARLEARDWLELLADEPPSWSSGVLAGPTT